MASLYGSGPAGTMIKVDAGGAYPLVVGGLSLPDDNLYATSISVKVGQSVHYLKSLNGKIYGYTWGDDVGSVDIQGIILFSPKCAFTSAGMSKVLGFYNSSNVYKKSSPTSVTIGGYTIEAFLKGCVVTLDNPVFHMGNFSLSFDTLPKR